LGVVDAQLLCPVVVLRLPHIEFVSCFHHQVANLAEFSDFGFEGSGGTTIS
jgi:hypothetical protein